MYHKMNEANRKLEEAKRAKIKAQKRCSKLKNTLADRKRESEGVTSSNAKVTELQDLVATLENNKLMLEEQVSEFINQDVVQTFKGGAYVNEVREVYMEMISKNVSIKDCEGIIRTLLSKLGGMEVDPCYKLKATFWQRFR